MKVSWRDKQYNFIPRTLTAGKDKPRESDLLSNIYGFDTESVDLPDRYEPICFQISNDTGGESLVYLPPYCRGLEKFLDYWVKHFSWFEFENRTAFMFGHNLMYDWLQLVKYYPDLVAMARTGVGLDKDYEIYRKDYFVILRKNALFTGNAPHFSLKIGISSREWVNLKFRDTFSFFPTSLKKLAKQLKLEEKKMERQSDLGRRDYRQEEMSEDKSYFERYAKLDSKVTRLVAEQIRELHKGAGMQRIRVSAPGYAINYLFHTIPEGTKLKTGSDDVGIMQLILDTYAGGRTGGIYHGKIENMSVLDFHSSYPASMVSLPSFLPTMEYITHPNPESISSEELIEIISECHCFMRVSGEETDALYPSIITNRRGKLTPVYGRFEYLATTGVEVSVGIKSGTLRIDKVHELVLLVEMEPPEILPFKVFAESAYNRKNNAEKGGPEYNSAKLVLNSAYGKLIESRTETMVADDVKNIILPYVKGMEVDFGKMYYSEYIKTLNEESEKTFAEIYPELVDNILNEFPDEEIGTANFGRLSLTELNYGRYAIPAGASLITATSRARLIAVAKSTKGLYWDTDSVFLLNYNIDLVNEKLKTASTWLPPFVKGLKVGEELGDLDCELSNASGYLAGTKRYYLENEIHRDCKTQDAKEACKTCLLEKKCKVKKAVHGIPTAPFDKASEMIRLLATGSNNIYDGKARPKGVKESKDVKEIGRFISKQYESQFHLDDRLEWVEVNGGWSGKIKELQNI